MAPRQRPWQVVLYRKDRDDVSGTNSWVEMLEGSTAVAMRYARFSSVTACGRDVQTSAPQFLPPNELEILLSALLPPKPIILPVLFSLGGHHPRASDTHADPPLQAWWWTQFLSRWQRASVQVSTGTRLEVIRPSLVGFRRLSSHDRDSSGQPHGTSCEFPSVRRRQTRGGRWLRGEYLTFLLFDF